MDDVMDESIGSDECDGCYGKTYSLLDLEIKLVQIEHYTTALEKELREKENLENHSSPASPEQAQTTDNDELQSSSNIPNQPSPTFTNPIPKDENEGLKVGDKVIYVGKKHRESIGNQVMKVVKISVHWTGNQVTCSYDKGWTTWIPENCLKRAKG